MKIKNLILFAASLLGGGMALTGCSANDVPGLVARGDVALQLQLLAADEEGVLKPVSDITLPAVNAERIFEVRSNTLWRAEIPDCPGNWVGVQNMEGGVNAEGSGDGSFRIVAHDNVSETQRTPCILWIYVVDSAGNVIPGESLSYAVKQLGQSIAVTPMNVPNFDAEGTFLQQFSITVKGSTHWKVECSNLYSSGSSDTEKFVVIEGEMEGTGNANFTVRLLPNPYETQRKSRLRIVSPENAFPDISVDLIQDASETRFYAWVDEATIPAEGGEYTLTIFSPNCRWNLDIKGADGWDKWLHIDTDNGPAAPDVQKIMMIFSPNTTYNRRDVTIDVVPENTDQKYKTIPISLLQMTAVNPKPIVSTPWLEELTPDRVTMCASYLCPSSSASAVGAKFRLNDASTGELVGQPKEFTNINKGGDILKATFGDLEGMKRYRMTVELTYKLESGGTETTSSEAEFTTPGYNVKPDEDNVPPTPQRPAR